MANPSIVQKLIDQFTKMPSIGTKTAERMAYYIIKTSEKNIENLINSIKSVRENIKTCQICNNVADGTECSICKDKTRDQTIICVVEQPQDLICIEKSEAYKGLYHVLLGTLSPLDGIGPKDIQIGSLINRVKNSTTPLKEIILATNPNSNGEATALYITKSLKDLNIKISRIGFGISIGSDISYTDKTTILKSMQYRIPVA